jgi:hypothetical protein
VYSAPALRSGVTAVGVGWADGTGGAIGGQVEVMGLRRVGVEEELLLVEPGLGRPRAVAGTVLHAARQVATGPGRGPDAGPVAGDGAQALDFELQLQQLETNTQPCRALEELGREYGGAGRWPLRRRAGPGLRWRRWRPRRYRSSPRLWPRVAT